MADEQLTDSQPEQTALFPRLQQEPPELPVWARDGRVSPVGHILTVPPVAQAPADEPYATWLRTDCLVCGQYSEWAYTAEVGNTWESRHRDQTEHTAFYSFSFSRIRFDLHRSGFRVDGGADAQP